MGIADADAADSGLLRRHGGGGWGGLEDETWLTST